MDQETNLVLAWRAGTHRRERLAGAVLAAIVLIEAGAVLTALARLADACP